MDNKERSIEIFSSEIIQDIIKWCNPWDLYNIANANELTRQNSIKSLIDYKQTMYSQLKIVYNGSQFWACYTDNNLYMYGYSSYCFRHYSLPSNIKSIRHVSLGADHVMLLTRDNNLYSFGSNQYGQLGRKSTKFNSDDFLPVMLPSDCCHNIKYVLAAYHFSVVLTNKGVYGYGNCFNSKNNVFYGKNFKISKFEINFDVNTIIKLEATIHQIFFLTRHKILYICGRYKKYNYIFDCSVIKTVQLSIVENVSHITTEPHGAALATSEGIYVKSNYSDNHYGHDYTKQFKCWTKISNLPTVLKIKKIVFGSDHIVVLANERCLYGFGNNRFGQLGLGKGCVGIKEFTKISLPNEIENIFEIAAGHDFTLIWCNNGLYITGLHQNYIQKFTFCNLSEISEIPKEINDLVLIYKKNSNLLNYITRQYNLKFE